MVVYGIVGFFFGLIKFKDNFISNKYDYTELELNRPTIDNLLK